MKSTSFIYRSSLVLTLLIPALCLTAQEQKASDGFVPQVGQKGKDVVWVPTPQDLVDKMLQVAKVGPQDFLIDLGSGDGRTVITAAKLGANALGVEYNPEMVKLSKENAEKAGVTDKAQFVEGDLFQTDLSKATVITMFLLPEINLKLRPKLLDLKPGTRVVSNTFTMGDWEEDYKVSTDESWSSWNTAYMWIIPARVEGKWKTGNGELTLTQQYQFFKGTLGSNGKSYEISEGRLNGDQISFTANGEKYSGKINGGSMTGTYVNEKKGSMADWAATR
ncbi:MAG: class I SAM-dependent methyltransferase [Bacteroidales bacterium]